MGTIAACIMTVLLMAAPQTAWAWEYVIGEGDGLNIQVWGERELSQTVRVRPDGMITLPTIGDVRAAELTPAQLQDALVDRLKNVVKRPAVTVTVTEVTNNKVYLFGGGVPSGVYTLTQRTTLLQVLCQAGQQAGAEGGAVSRSVDAIRNADLRKAYVQRNKKRIKTDFYNLFVNGETSEDITLEPNDVIFIPPVADRYVYVMGAVTQPNTIEYRKELTVMEAILSAGGFTKYADQNGIVVYRKNEGKETIIPVKIKNLVHDGDLTQNIRLKPGDFIVVREGIF